MRTKLVDSVEKDTDLTVDSAEKMTESAALAFSADSATQLTPQDWHKLHPITPLAQLGKFWLAIVLALFAFISNMVETGAISDIKEVFTKFERLEYVALIVSGVLLGISLLVVLFSWLVWRKMSYAVVNSGVHYRTGIFFKKHAQLRWDRIQTIEIEQRLLGRLFGLGAVKISSGAGDEDVSLELLKLAQCGKLRAELLRILELARQGLPFQVELQADGSFAAKVDSVDAEVLMAATSAQPMRLEDMKMQVFTSDTAPHLDADDLADDQLVYELPLSRVILGSLVDSRTLVIIFIFLPGFLLPYLLNYSGVSIIALIFAGFSLFTTLFGMISAEFGTRIYVSDNGLRKRSGLLTVKTRTFPPQRIHAIQINQPMLWRCFNWWSIKIAVAGEGLLEENTSVNTYFAMACKPEEALRLLWYLIPDLGAEDNQALLKEALEGRNSGQYFQGTSSSARWIDPVTHTGKGIYVNEKIFAVRFGRLGRTVSLTLQDHIQSMCIEAGPLDRKLGLATLQANIVHSGVVSIASNLPRELLEKVLWQQSVLTRAARAKGVSETLQEWKLRVGFTK